MRLLFVCSQNRLRSLTAEHLLDGENGHEVRSAGTEAGARQRVKPGLLGWAEVVFVMERRHVDRLRAKFSSELEGKPIINLRIPDEYMYMDEALIGLLRERLGEYFPAYVPFTQGGCADLYSTPGLRL